MGLTCPSVECRLAAALRDGLLEGPTLDFGNRVLLQTGGHADLRAPEEDNPACPVRPAVLRSTRRPVSLPAASKA
jgi:hypothetical protein